jgi:type VI secretion system protein ImpL
MDVLKKLTAFIPPKWKPFALIFLALLAIIVPLFLVWRAKRKTAAAGATAAPEPLAKNRLRQVRQKFLAGLPLRHRVAVRDLPGVVVMGPAGAGKSRLIDLDLDWKRQARQFLPSLLTDSLLQVYLGADIVAQEVSAQLLEDETPQGREALRRLWKDSFGEGQQALAVLVLDARWLSDTPPDEVRRAAQLLRGKLNLLAEVRGGALETRVCLTHLDEREGYSDFAKLLRAYHVPLRFPLPPPGQEGQLGSLLKTQEQYLALGLTALPVESFERLERFYSEGHAPFEALSRFVTALMEGQTLAFAPRLATVSLSSADKDARDPDVLSVSAEASSAKAVHERYLHTHLRRAVVLGLVCALPLLAAYGHFTWRLGQARTRVQRFEEMVQRMRDQGHEVSGAAVEEPVLAAGQSLDTLWRAMNAWPLLRYSFTSAREDLRQRLARGIREAHIRPSLEKCHRQPETCRPEQVVYLLATLHGSREEPLGQLVLSSLKTHRNWSFVSSEGTAADPGAAAVQEAGRSWVTAVGLNESLVADYVTMSNPAWSAPDTPEANWARWPFPEPLTLESQLTPWQAHLRRLQDLMANRAVEPRELERLDSELESMQDERRRLQALLDDSARFASLPRALELLAASEARVDTSRFRGIQSTLKTVAWINDHRDVLTNVLRMEEEAYLGVKAVQKMSVAELLVRDGLWIPGNGPAVLQMSVLQSTFEFRPKDGSRLLHQALLRYHEKMGRMPFGVVAGEEPVASRSGASLSADRLEFDTRLRPLVDEFTTRIKGSGLPVEEVSQREEHVRRKVNQFAFQYRNRLFQRVSAYRFQPVVPALLPEELSRLTQPSSELVDMLRDVAQSVALEPLEGPFYESLRNAVAPFKPISTVMKPDESGNYTALNPYRALVAQLADELNAAPRQGVVPKEATASLTGGAAPSGATAPSNGAAKLPELLTPLGRLAFAMMLEDETSYLHKVDAWLDQQGLIGELRQPFRQPFLAVRELGQREIERTLERQWDDANGRFLRPLLNRYPFSPEASQEVDPGDLEVLRKQDGAFWDFVTRVIAPVAEERGSEWVARGALQSRLSLPGGMLPTLGRLSRLARMLWDAEGRPRPLMLQVMPLPLPKAPTAGSFVTLGSLKCGKTTFLAYNQSPSWQEFPLAWWDQQTASLMLEVRAPADQSVQYASLEKTRSAWSCFRLLESSQSTEDPQHRQWSLRARGGASTDRVMDLRFGLKGEPWTPFREVPR